MEVRESDLLQRDTPAVPLLPVIDADGLVRKGDTWVALSPIEARLARAFLERPGQLLGRKTLGNAGWPDGVPNERVGRFAHQDVAAALGPARSEDPHHQRQGLPRRRRSGRE